MKNIDFGDVFALGCALLGILAITAILLLPIALLAYVLQQLSTGGA